MKRPQLLQAERGTVAWVGLLVLIAVIVGAVAVMQLLPRSPVPKPVPTVVRGKIPPMPSPTPARHDEISETTVADGAAPLASTPDDAPSYASVDRPRQAPAPSASEGFADASQAASMIASDKTDETPSIPKDGGAQPLMPAVAPTTPSVEPAPVAHAPIEDVRTEKTESATTTGMTATAVAGNMLPSDKTAAISEEGAAFDPGAAKAIETQGLAQDGGQPEAEIKKPFTIQVGAFHNRAFAQNLIDEMDKRGYTAFIHESTDRDRQPLHLVCFGRFGSLDEAMRSAETFTQKENKPAFVLISESR